MADFRVFIPEEVFVDYDKQTSEAAAHVLAQLKKRGGWKWTVYNERSEMDGSYLYEAHGVQPEAAQLMTAMSKGHDIIPHIDSIFMKILEGVL